MNFQKNVKNLVETFDLEMPKHYFRVTNYYELDGCIVITEIQVFDDKGNFIRNADLSKAVKSLNYIPVSFASIK